MREASLPHDSRVGGVFTTSRCEVVEFNRFLNPKLNLREYTCAVAGIDHDPDSCDRGGSGPERARRGETYADFTAGEYDATFDPRGWLMVVRGHPASALEELGVAPGDSALDQRSGEQSRARYTLSQSLESDAGIADVVAQRRGLLDA